jgi:hypothetical protein
MGLERHGNRTQTKEDCAIGAEEPLSEVEARSATRNATAVTAPDRPSGMNEAPIVFPAQGDVARRASLRSSARRQGCNNLRPTAMAALANDCCVFITVYRGVFCAKVIFSTQSWY